VAKVRQLLNGASVEVALRRRICHRNRKGHSIAANTRCLVVKDPASGGSKNYCPECADEILLRVDVDLAALRNELSGAQ
jgi:hypothetical protein